MMKRLFERFSVQKLYDDLDYWIFIGIGQDIVDFKSQRPEYAPLVDLYSNEENIPMSVLFHLREELQYPWYARPSFWRLVKISIRRLLWR